MTFRIIIARATIPLAATLIGGPTFAAAPSAAEDPRPATPPMIPAVAVLPAQADADAAETPVAADPAPDPAQVECVAKVILHEAANEPTRGQIAVAQVIRARMKDGRFASDACAVIRQRGQFFDVDAYQPARDTQRWSAAAQIAATVLSHADEEEVAPGALFFHAARSAMPSRVRIAQVGGHVFYR